MDPQADEMVDRVYEVVARSPGRVRVRLPCGAGSAVDLAQIGSLLEARAGVSSARTNGGARSVVVTFDPVAVNLEDLLQSLQDAGYRGRRAEPVPPRMRSRAVAGPVTSALADSSQQARWLEDSGLTATVAMGALSARQLARNGFQLDRAPWYTFAWYAYSLYRSWRDVREV